MHKSNLHDNIPPNLTSISTDRNILAYCSKVYDGDTIHVVYDMFDVYYSKRHMLAPRPLNGWITKSSVRLFGYDTAEVNSKDPELKSYANLARDELAKLILNKYVHLEIKGTDKYGRLLGVIYEETLSNIFPDYEKSINKHMASKFGKEYYGEGSKLTKSDMHKK